MLYIAVFVCFTSVFMFAYGVLYSLNYSKILVENRVELIKNLHDPNREYIENTYLAESLLTHIYNVFCNFLMDVTPEYKLAVLNKKLEKAGLLINGTVEKWLYAKNMIMLIAFILSSLLSYIIEPSIAKAFIIAIIIVLFANTCLNFYIAKRFEMRKKNIIKDLPYTLDLITVSVEAGASFDGAIAKVISNIRGELCDEFSKCLKEIKMGIQRKAALKNMSERCDVKELSMLVNSLIQADELGVSLGRVLRIEAANLREHRKQMAREKAMKAPIKMLFPLIFFIFPSIFIIILGPAVIRIFSIFR